MKKSVFILFALSQTLFGQAQMRMAVIADPHVLSTSLFDDGSAFNDAKNGSSRVIEYSQQLFDSAVSIITDEQPELVLLVGDLTNDGEKVSHQHIVAKLAQLKNSGIQPIVIPGNNDIANKNAYLYQGDKKVQTESVSQAEFESLYSDFGLSQAVSREKDSLSYMVYPTDKLAVICLNSAKKNTPATQYNEGGLYESTIAWAESAAAKAKSEGRMVIAMMHHQITDHFNMENEMTPSYVANTTDGYPALENLQSRLLAAGVEVVLTGHYHMTSIKHTMNEGKQLYDVGTGSLSSYPSPIRWLTLSNNGQLNITTQTIDTYHELELKRNENTAMGLISRAANTAYPMIDKVKNDAKINMMLTFAHLSFDDFNMPSSKAQMQSDMASKMLPSMTTMINELSRGDENTRQPAENLKACMDGVDAYVKDVVCGGNEELADVLQVLIAEYRTMLYSMCHSVFYNYVGEDATQVVPDNANTLTINVPVNTALDAVSNNPLSTKILNNGTIYILRNGHVYDVLGKQLD